MAAPAVSATLRFNSRKLRGPACSRPSPRRTSISPVVSEPDVVIDYKTQRFEDHARDLDMVLDLIDGETRERSWQLLKRGGVLVSTLSEPSQEAAARHGVRAMRYTVEASGNDLAAIIDLAVSGKVKPHVQRTFRLEDAARALAAVEHGGTVGKVVLSLE